MGTLERLIVDARYVADIAGFLRKQISLDEARSTVEHRLATRAESFLYILERGIYANPRSAYARLLAHAAIELAELQRDVRELGLEATLEKLYDAGVYLTSEEIKGRQLIRRGDLEFYATPADFDNPLVRDTHILNVSSGSTGQSIAVRTSLKSVASEAVDVLIGNVSQFGDRPMAYWGSLIIGLLWYTKADRRPDKVFFTSRPPKTMQGLRQRFILQYTRFVSRLFGRPLPEIEIVPRDQAVRIARWLAEMSARGTPAVMLGHSNPAVRICLAAREHGLDISGTLFIVYGEPFTPGKAAVLASVGATSRVQYSMSEVGGMVAISCANATELDDAHVFTDKLALIQRERSVSADEPVGALIYTTVDPMAPRLLLNLDSGDYAAVTKRECSCLMGQLGLDTHLHHIRSYEKLTSEGNTFIGSRLYELVEEVLPARFGGGINDYQIVEEEQEDGLSRVLILVSPRVGPVDEPAVITTVLETLERSHEGGATMVDIWRQGRNLQVVRQDPYETRTAKVLPLHVHRVTAVGRDH